MPGRLDLHIFQGLSITQTYGGEVLHNHVMPHLVANLHLQMLQHDYTRPCMTRLTIVTHQGSSMAISVHQTVLLSNMFGIIWDDYSDCMPMLTLFSNWRQSVASDPPGRH